MPTAIDHDQKLRNRGRMQEGGEGGGTQEGSQGASGFVVPRQRPKRPAYRIPLQKWVLTYLYKVCFDFAWTLFTEYYPQYSFSPLPHTTRDSSFYLGLLPRIIAGVLGYLCAVATLRVLKEYKSQRGR